MKAIDSAASQQGTLVPLDHERLDVYRAADDLDELVAQACRRAPRGFAFLLDQVQRASTSLSLNIVEGNGRAGADRTQHFRIARGSAMEVDCAAALMARRSLLNPLERQLVRQLCSRIVSMLTKMMR
jgi:four helix bundle protein